MGYNVSSFQEDRLFEKLLVFEATGIVQPLNNVFVKAYSNSAFPWGTRFNNGESSRLWRQVFVKAYANAAFPNSL